MRSPSYAVSSQVQQLIADSVTPTSLYRKLRARFSHMKLLEGAEVSERGTCFSFLLLEPFAWIQAQESSCEMSFPDGHTETHALAQPEQLMTCLQNFFERFQFDTPSNPNIRNGLFGYFRYEAVQSFEHILLHQKLSEEEAVPLLRYEIFRHVIAINHIRNEVFLLTNSPSGEDGAHERFLETLREVLGSTYPQEEAFQQIGSPESNMTDDEQSAMIASCKQHIQRGDVFQIVPSRKFKQAYSGDNFQVYRALRVVNPSPYLYYGDYGDYQIFGSSPEAQIIVQNGRAEIHPIAGTCPRSGDIEQDELAVQELCDDPKENSEHVMLVDLARNDLSRHCDDVRVDAYREVHRYSHVFHLVSKVSGRLREGVSALRVLADTFPAGTLSGAPKFKAMELIDRYEKGARGIYAGGLGFFDTEGGCLHAILIRSFLAKDGFLFRQAGGGVVDESDPEKELLEVRNKLQALQKALDLASHPDGLFLYSSGAKP